MNLFLQHFGKSHNRNKAGWNWIGTSTCLYFSYLNILWSISVIFPHITLFQIKSFYIWYQCTVRIEGFWGFFGGFFFCSFVCFALCFSFRKMNKTSEREAHTEWPTNGTEFFWEIFHTSKSQQAKDLLCFQNTFCTTTLFHLKIRFWGTQAKVLFLSPVTQLRVHPIWGDWEILMKDLLSSSHNI